MTSKDQPLRLGVNIDHVATLRNARGVDYPDPLRAAVAARDAGADGITAHLREDRRHIRDEDIQRLQDQCGLPLNLEMAATDEMVAIAVDLRPHAVCLVPEKRAELTTEGGLHVVGHEAALKPAIARLLDAGVRVSLFIDPETAQIEAAARLNAPVVELHTGTYCDAPEGAGRQGELARIVQGAEIAAGLGIECHAGHGLTFDTVAPIAAIASIVELNIGHFLIGEAVFLGMKEAVGQMRARMDAARSIS